MSSSLLFSDKDDIDNPNTSPIPIHPSTEHTQEEEEQVNTWTGLTLRENDTFFNNIKRLGIYWRRILFNKIRLIFTLLFMSMLNVTARIACFTRRQTPSSPSFTSLANSASSSTETLEENFNDSAKSLLLSENTHQQHIHLPSLSNSTMAHILVRQQSHRTPNMSIHRSTTSQKDPAIQMTHSVDDRLFLQDSSRFLHLLKRFASEPQMEKYNTQSINTNGHISESSVVFAETSPVPKSCVTSTESENDEIHFDDILSLNCDKIQPVSTSSLTEDLDSDKTDNITMAMTIDPLSEQVASVNDGLKSQTLDEDILIDISPSLNGNDQQNDRHFRRRKRRSSLTRNSFTLDEPSPTINLLEKLDVNQQQSSEIKENLEVYQNDHKQDMNGTETKTSENEESDQVIVEDETPASVSRYRGRRLRHRFYRQSASATASPQEVSSSASPDFYLPNEALDVETPRIYSPPLSSPTTTSPPSSPISPTLTIISHPVTPIGSTGSLKRINSVGTSKKNVRFADSVGRELTQVQYIHSSSQDEAKELSFLLGSSLFSSSPPSFTKNNLYLPNTLRLEHKPWSFDVASTSKTLSKGKTLPRRFFCLYRQPNSEHPDIYLHEVWKSQIKLEHADIPLRRTPTGAQQLIGTLWVTNASYWKYVSIKYTFNRWLNTCEREAQYRCHSNDYRNLDQFEFAIDIPDDVDRIDFVLRYCVNGQEHWDNNEGKNYTLQTESAYTPSTTISLPHDCDFNEMRFY